jgi:hypothetical protein
MPLPVCLVAAIFCACALSAAEQQKAADKDAEKPEATKFIRVAKSEDDSPQSMDTAIVRYTPADSKFPKLKVDLIAAVHVGEAEYYRQLNRRFKKYDALLYELVAPEGTRIPKGGGGATRSSPLGAVQGGMTSVLGLKFQLEEIDYTPENLVHADLSPEEFSRSMKDRGESFMQMFFRMMGQAMAQQSRDPSGSGDMKLLMALFAKDRELRLKRIMAEQFQDLEGSIAALEGPNGSTIISERNKRALEVLQKQIKAGKRRIGIFYGAGHLPGMERRLIDDFGLERAGVEWLEAWNLRQ